ncbi:MAG: AI-2E family transporter [Anaerotignaceae bacterium]
MKLPWDTKYLKISFHIVITAVAIFIAIGILARFSLVATGVTNVLKQLVSLLSPLIIGIVVAFLFNPVVEFFTKWFKPTNSCGFRKRTKATAITYLTVFIVLGSIISLTVKSVGATDITEISNALNKYIQELSDMLISVQVALSHNGILGNLNGVINDVIISLTRSAKMMVASLGQKVTSIGGITIDLAIGLVVAFYFLAEKERIIFRLKDTTEVFLPKRISDGICVFFADVNKVFSGYVTGQVLDALIMATLIIVCFWAAGIKYAVVIGLISGFSNLIPYIGAVVAFILSVLVGLVSGAPIKALYAAIIVIILQQIDGCIIVPKVVGKSVELHPVLVILSLAFFGGLFGLWGMIVAVPVTALIKIYADRAYVRKKKLEL